MIEEFIKAEKGLLLLSQKLLDDLRKELESIPQIPEKSPTDRKKMQTCFENYDQKVNQLFNILSATLKSIKEMSNGVTRNML